MFDCTYMLNFQSVLFANHVPFVYLHVRFPFLLVDRVIDYKPGEYAVGIKNVTINDNFFTGHFPERPIMPGVLMAEVYPYMLIAFFYPSSSPNLLTEIQLFLDM